RVQAEQERVMPLALLERVAAVRLRVGDHLTLVFDQAGPLFYLPGREHAAPLDLRLSGLERPRRTLLCRHAPSVFWLREARKIQHRHRIAPPRRAATANGAAGLRERRARRQIRLQPPTIGRHARNPAADEPSRGFTLSHARG